MTAKRDDTAEESDPIPPTELADRIYWGLLVIFQLAMAVELVLLLFDQQWLNAVITIGIMMLILAPALVAPRFHVRIPAEFQLLAVTFVFASLFLGETQAYYDRFVWWDTALHASSGLLLGVLGFLLVYILNENRRVDLTLRPGFVAFFAFLFAVACGAVWEIFEYVMDQLIGSSMQHGGLDDTMWDLIFDTIGAALISLFGWRYLKREERSFIERWVQKFIERNPRMFRR